MMAGSLVLAAPAAALSKHVFSTSITGSGATALSNPTDVALDPTSGDLYVANTAEDSWQTIEVNALGGSFTLTFKGQTTAPIRIKEATGLNPGALAGKIQKALEGLSTVGAGNLQVFNDAIPAGMHYIVIFEGELSDTELPQLSADVSGLLGGAAAVHIRTLNHGASSADIERLTPSGELVYIAGKEVNQTKIEQSDSTEAERNLCTAASGDTCKPGTPGSTPGAFDGAVGLIQIGSGNNYSTYFSHSAHHLYLAVDPTSGDLYVGDPGAGEVTKLSPQGNLVTSWGDGGRLDGTGLAPSAKFKGGQGDINALIVRPDGTLLVGLGGGGTSVITGLVSKTVVRFASDGTFLKVGLTAETPETFGISGDTIDPTSP